MFSWHETLKSVRIFHSGQLTGAHGQFFLSFFRWLGVTARSAAFLFPTFLSGHLKNVCLSLDLAWICCPLALITIKLESRLLLSRDAARRGRPTGSQCVIVIWYGLALPRLLCCLLPHPFFRFPPPGCSLRTPGQKVQQWFYHRTKRRERQYWVHRPSAAFIWGRVLSTTFSGWLETLKTQLFKKGSWRGTFQKHSDSVSMWTGGTQLFWNTAVAHEHQGTGLLPSGDGQ